MHGFFTTKILMKNITNQKQANEYAIEVYISWESVAVEYFSPMFLSSMQRILPFGLAKNEIELETTLWKLIHVRNIHWGRRKIIIIFVIRGREIRIDHNLLLLQNETTVQLNEHTATPLLNVQFSFYIHSFERYFHSVIIWFLLLPPIHKAPHWTSKKQAIFIRSRAFNHFFRFLHNFPFCSCLLLIFIHILKLDAVNNIFFLRSFCLLMHIEKYIMSFAPVYSSVWAYS